MLANLTRQQILELGHLVVGVAEFPDELADPRAELLLDGGTLTIFALSARFPLGRGGCFHLREFLPREERLSLRRPGLLVGVFDGAAGLVGEVAAVRPFPVDEPEPIAQRRELRAQRLGLSRVFSLKRRLLAPVLAILDPQSALQFLDPKLETRDFCRVSLCQRRHRRLLTGELSETFQRLVALTPQFRNLGTRV